MSAQARRRRKVSRKLYLSMDPLAPAAAATNFPPSLVDALGLPALALSLRVEGRGRLQVSRSPAAGPLHLHLTFSNLIKFLIILPRTDNST